MSIEKEEIEAGLGELANTQNFVADLNMEMKMATSACHEFLDGMKDGKRPVAKAGDDLSVGPDQSAPRKPLVVNLFAGPGSGKSTGAAFLFAYLKLAGVNAELVTEFAKELAWEGDKEFMANNQVYITGQQVRRMNRLVGKVDVIITDSPIELGALYTEEETLKALCAVEGKKFDNRIDFFVRRTKAYNPSGRNQTFQEAVEIDRRILAINPSMTVVDGNLEGYFKALLLVLDRLGIKVDECQYSDIISKKFINTEDK